VLLLDLEKLRENNFEELVIYLVREYGIYDQVALNIYANGNYEELPASWNVFVGQENPIERNIIHWVGGGNKPWNNPNVPFAEYWRKYYQRLNGLKNNPILEVFALITKFVKGLRRIQ